MCVCVEHKTVEEQCPWICMVRNQREKGGRDNEQQMSIRTRLKQKLMC